MTYHSESWRPAVYAYQLRKPSLAAGGFHGLSQHSWYARGVRVGRRGRKRQLDLESEYWKLLQSGVGTVAACKLLGIGRKTGYRWRAENGGLPPGRLAESALSGRYLCLLERQRIATLRERGLGVC